MAHLGDMSRFEIRLIIRRKLISQVAIDLTQGAQLEECVLISQTILIYKQLNPHLPAMAMEQISRIPRNLTQDQINGCVLISRFRRLSTAPHFQPRWE